MKKFLILPILTLINYGAFAQTNNNSVKDTKATATLTATCLIKSPGIISFGEYNPSANNHIYVTGEISFLCSSGIRFWAMIEGTESNLALRDFRGFGSAMSIGSTTGKDRLYFHIDDYQFDTYVGSNKGRYWMTMVNGVANYHYGTGKLMNYPLNLTLFKGQYVRSGNYTDTFTITINY